MTHPPIDCPVCHASFVPTRADAIVCSATCRQRRKRGTVVATPELRAEVAEFIERHGHGHPLERPYTPEEVAAYVAATAERT